MKRMSWWLTVMLALCVGCLAMACRQDTSPAEDGLPGAWVLKSGDLVFMVLTLEQKGETFSGSLARPERLTTSDGVTFSGVGPGATTRPIVSATRNDTGLRIVIQNPNDPADTDDLDFTLVDGDHASLTLVGLPFEPFRFTRNRAPEVPVVHSTWDPQRTYMLDQPRHAPNPEMAAIFDEDQAVRQSNDISAAQWVEISKGDAERRRKTKALLDAGRLRAGEDFHKAAFVFQHGDTSDDFLLAHTLALVALAKGHVESRWIATATLDRYLGSVGKPQIYGTQFRGETRPGAPLTQEPYNRTLIADTLRTALGVPTIDKQMEQAKAMAGQ